MGCHAQAIQLPYNACYRALDKLSLAFDLVRLPMADRMVSQAPAFDAGAL